MIKEEIRQTVDTVRERERERESKFNKNMFY